jgi:hypothetical protein
MLSALSCIRLHEPQIPQVSDIVAYKFAVHSTGIRALSPALAVKFNISPGRWQHFPQFIHYITIKTVLVIFHYPGPGQTIDL